MITPAYIDPSVGSLVFQVAAAAILGAVVTVKMWWARVTGVIGGLLGQNKENE